MNDNNCKGCPKDRKYCTVSKTIKNHELENECPCVSCLVKVQCESWCPDFKSYCKHLYDDVEHDLVLLIMSESTTVFTRNNTYVIGSGSNEEIL